MGSGRLFVISGPSGVGKGTIVRRLLELQPLLKLSISCTTRPARPGEVDGREYHFVSEEVFESLVEDGAFLEWTQIYGGHRYGTLAGPVAEELASGRHVVLEIDIQGARTVRALLPEAVLIFLMPPSQEALAQRLRSRATESEDQVAWRLASSQQEMEQHEWFDHTVVNDEVTRAAAEVAAIIERTVRPERNRS